MGAAWARPKQFRPSEGGGKVPDVRLISQALLTAHAVTTQVFLAPKTKGIVQERQRDKRESEVMSASYHSLGTHTRAVTPEAHP